jgi:hypothetical protein
LYFKNSAGVVTLLASNAATTGVDSLSFGSTGLTPSTATTGAITVAGTLNVLNGGTGVTTSTGTGSVVLSTSPTLVTPALGTPSSGTVTNLTGTASININGTVGATTANTGAFTTLSATGSTTINGSFNNARAAGTDNYINYSTTGIQNTVMGFNNSGSTNGSGVLNNTSYFGSLNSFPVSIITNGTVVGTFATNGNLGLGSASPNFSGFGSSTTGLQVTNANNAAIRLNGNAGGDFYFVSGSGQHWLYATGAVPIGVYTNSTQRFVFGASGQFGIGASPSYGTAGEVLTSGGSGAAPTWSSPAGGSWVYLTTVTASNSATVSPSFSFVM